MSQPPPTAVVAEPERRFQAFAIDRAIAWSLFGAAVAAAWWFFFREDKPWPGIGLIVGCVLVVSLVFAVQAGLTGRTPGKAMRGLKVVDPEGGKPIGVPRSMLRSLIVGIGSLPMFGLGVATLAWTAVEDRTRERRGWHDHVTRSIVIDTRSRPVIEAEAEDRPRHVVNLTAMKLMPVRAPAAPVVPAPSPGTGSQVRIPGQHGTPAQPDRQQAPSWGPAAGPAPGPGQAPAQPGPWPVQQQGFAQQSPAQQPPAQQPSVQQPPSPGRSWGPPPSASGGPAPQAPQQSPPATGALQGGAPNQQPNQQPSQQSGQQPGQQFGQQFGQAQQTPPQAPDPRATPPAPPAEPDPAQRTQARPAMAGRHTGPVRSMTWRVTFDSGESFVVEGLGIVGRAPAARPGEPVRHAIPLQSSNMSISKTHAQFHLASDGALVVTDRGSTNGSVLVRKGVSRELAPGRPTTLVDGDRVVFGDRSMNVTREGS